jgi:uncharacterized protein YbjQ (UPF0145 family)
MIITTSHAIAGKEITQTIGLVKGSATRSKMILSDIVAGLRTIVGGEVKEYTQLMNEVREQAIGRLEESAKESGADAVIGMRMSTSAIMQGVSEIVAYGTAVKLK